jgi:hypothetical protein
MDISQLKFFIEAEIAAARLTGAETDQQIADHCNAPIYPADDQRVTVSAEELLQAIVPVEYAGILSAPVREGVRIVLGLGDRIGVRNSNARNIMLTAFTATTQTRVNLAALANTASDRARHARAGHLGYVRPGHIALARV